MNIVIKGDDKLISEIRLHYANKIENNANVPYSQFVVKDQDYSIIVYNSKKIMFQGKGSSTQATLWDNNISTKSPINDYVCVNYTEHIGSDEVGTGDYFGPVVVVASYVNETLASRLKGLNIQDTKKLKDSEIIKMALILIKEVPHVKYLLPNTKYNEAIKTDNMNAIKAKMHNYVMWHLNKQYQRKIPSIIDQFCSPKNYYQYLHDTKDVFKDLIFETKAEDKYLAVAISAIIARYYFLEEMDQLSLLVKQPLQKGAGHLVDQQGASIYEEYGPSIFNSIAKVHFKNTQKIKELINQ